LKNSKVVSFLSPFKVGQAGNLWTLPRSTFLYTCTFLNDAVSNSYCRALNDIHIATHLSYVFNVRVNKRHNHARHILTIFRLSLPQTTANVAQTVLL